MGRGLPGRRHATADSTGTVPAVAPRATATPPPARCAGFREVDASASARDESRAAEADDFVEHDDYHDHDDHHDHDPAADLFHDVGHAVDDDNGSAVDHDDVLRDDHQRAGGERHLGLIEAFGDG